MSGSALDAAILSMEARGRGLEPRESARLAGLYFLKGDRSEGEKAASLFRLAKETADRAVRDDSESAEAAYWRAMALLGMTSSSRGPAAYLDVRAAIRDLENARSKDPGIDSYGPDRTLGRVFDEAPAWSLLRDRRRALGHLKEAASRSPDFALNRLYLAEVLIHSGRSDEARSHLVWILDRLPEGAAGDDADIRKNAKRILREMGNYLP